MTTTLHTNAIAAWLATHTPPAQHYQLVAVPGVELQPACPFCGKEAHARACAPLRAKLMRSNTR